MISHFFTRPRAEARLPRQPSTLAPSAHPRGAFLSYGNEVSYTIKKSYKPCSFNLRNCKIYSPVSDKPYDQTVRILPYPV